MATHQVFRLSIDRADIPLLLQHTLLASSPKRRRLYQTFYDTPDNTLTKLGITIYETRVLRKTTMTVKQAPNNKSGNDAPVEWSGITTPGAFDFSTLIDIPEMAEALSQHSSALIPLFAIDISQRHWSIQIRSARIDVILQDGELTTSAGAIQRSIPLSEIELRLVAGQPAALYGAARLLSRQVRLHPVYGIFLQRAIEFRNSESAKPVKARRVVIDPKSSTTAVFKRIAWLCMDQLQENERGIFNPDNIEFIHQARVALRRLRTALRIFNTELPSGFSDKWGQAWRDVGEQLGNARNWDVFCSEILPAISKDLGEHQDVIHLQIFAERQRSEAHGKAQQWLQGRHYSLTMIAFYEALLTLKDDRHERIDSLAEKSLKKRYKRFCRGAHVAHTLSGEERHEVRIDLKKLRYALDFFESLYPPKQLQPLLAGLAETQELLGQMNDLVTCELLLSMRPNIPLDLPVAWCRGKMNAYLAMLPSALKPVLSAKTPW